MFETVPPSHLFILLQIAIISSTYLGGTTEFGSSWRMGTHATYRSEEIQGWQEVANDCREGFEAYRGEGGSMCMNAITPSSCPLRLRNVFFPSYSPQKDWILL